jgi:hypothetical protein
LTDVVRANRDILFIVKPHPLSNLTDMPGRENLIVAKADDNIHFLIDCAKWVVCYNSGVGLLALLHSKRVFTVGNAFYNYEGAGYRAASLADALKAAQREPVPPSEEMIRRLAAWFTQRKYSTFIATDEVRDLGNRKTHGYKDILVTRFRLDDIDCPLGRMKATLPLAKQSYLSARIGMEPKPAPKPAPAAPAKKSPSAPVSVKKPAASSNLPPNSSNTVTPPQPWGYVRTLVHRTAQVALAPHLSEQDRARLRNNPTEFFQRAKWGPNRFFGRLLLDKSQRPY